MSPDSVTLLSLFVGIIAFAATIFAIGLAIGLAL